MKTMKRARQSRPNSVRSGLRCAGIGGIAIALASACLVAFAANPLPFSDRETGISCPYYDVQVGAAWPSGKPEGVDVEDALNGLRAFATERFEVADTRRVRRLDITKLVQSWWSGERDNDGLLLRVVGGDMLVFHARETSDPSLRPQLLLHGMDGKQRFLEPAADATLDCSTYRGLGAMHSLTARSDTWVAMRFELQPAKATNAAPPKRAELILVRTPESRPARSQLDVLALKSPLGQEGPPQEGGLARRYPNDVGIETDPAVFFADSFEAHGLDRRWTLGMQAPAITLNHDQANGFKPFKGRALRVTIPKGQQLGLDLRYRFRERHGSEPEEVYFRYHLRLAKDWLLALGGGKLPGLAGTYGRAGWGGRQWDGNKGWSLRGSFSANPPKTHPATGKIMLGTYAYHSKAIHTYGEGLQWITGGLAGLLEPDRWYCIEQQVKLNTPGKEDGVLKVWVNGQLALSREDIRLRDREDIRIEEVWMNFFHGGTDDAPATMHAYVDNLVIARKYIGPVAR